MFSKLAKAMLLMVSTLMISTSLHAIGGDVFLTTIRDPNGNFLSRSIMEFHSDGTLSIVDSAAQGAPNPNGFAPFSSEHGYWVKEDWSTVLLKAIDFNYPKFFTKDWPTGFTNQNQEIAMFEACLEKKCCYGYEGPVFLSFFPLDVENINCPEQGSGPIFVGFICLQKLDKPFMNVKKLIQ